MTFATFARVRHTKTSFLNSRGYCPRNEIGLIPG
jgi:hypothetical protein